MTNAETLCWCGRQTVLYTPRERSITQQGLITLRVCPEHGEGWRKAPESKD
ncbi:hypothetical protein HJG43_07100 [Kineosporiaceae bacterium SCSIO 59966]|nr:hypothetical protein HJG43_07100 [Kineosporiaceae bacterium SCSIO 59966]